jgi:flagellar basal body-associated protein FliL
MKNENPDFDNSAVKLSIILTIIAVVIVAAGLTITFLTTWQIKT